MDDYERLYRQKQTNRQQYQSVEQLQETSAVSIPQVVIAEATIGSIYSQRNARQIQAVGYFESNIQAMLEAFGRVHLQPGFIVSNVHFRYWDESGELPYRDIETAWWRLSGQLPAVGGAQAESANIKVAMYFYRRAGQRCFILQGVNLPRVDRIGNLYNLIWAMIIALIESCFAAIDNYRRWIESVDPNSRIRWFLRNAWRITRNALQITMRNFQILRYALTLNQLNEALSEAVPTRYKGNPPPAD